MSAWEDLIKRLKNALGLSTAAVEAPVVDEVFIPAEPANEATDTIVWESTELETAELSAVPETEGDSPALESAPVVENKRAKIVITVLSGKGGVGKTTTILGIAGDFLKADKKVLFVDLDPQGSLSTAVLDQPEVESVLGAFNGKTLQSLAVKSVWKEFPNQVYLVPAYRSLLAADGIVEPKNFDSVLATQLGDLSEFDVVLIDAPASLSRLTAEAVCLASNVVVVAEPSLYSLRSAADAFEFANDVKRVKRSWARTVKVVLNKLDESEESAYRAREIKRLFPGSVCRNSISLNPAVNYANATGLPVQALDSSEASTATAEFQALVKELLA